jgi:ABC-type sugar transport system permease subunit
MHWLSTKRAKAFMLIPTLLTYSIFIIIPVFIAVYYSFTQYSGLGKSLRKESKVVQTKKQL